MGLQETRQIIRHWGATWEDTRAAFQWAVPAEFNMAQACCEDWAQADPDRIALRHFDEAGREQAWSYGALSAASNRFANALRARGIGPGDRLAIYLSQGPETLIAHLAAYKTGAIALPLFTLFQEDALRYRLVDSGAAGVICEAGGVATITALWDDLPDLKAAWCISGAHDQIIDFKTDLERASPEFTLAPTPADTPALMIYTSGTTGDPKGVLHAHRVLLGHLPCIETSYEHFPRPGDIGWTPADWAWIGGLMDLAMPCLYYGVPLLSHRMRKFDPDAAYHFLKTTGASTLFLPPTALKLMRQASVPEGLRVRVIGSGGESLGADLLDWAQGALGAPINEFYGQTECNLVVTTMRSMMEAPVGAMGKAIPGHDLAILDSAGAPVAPGEEGEIAVAAPDPVMFLRYWNKPQKTQEKFVGKWMRTGDLGRMDEAGFLTYSSRDDDVITSSGYRIGPSEIEACLTGHEDVVMAAVIGVPDPVRTEAVTAYVVLREGAEWSGLEAALIARVRARLSPHLAPRKVIPIEALPMTATGKIMRRALRDL